MTMAMKMTMWTFLFGLPFFWNMGEERKGYCIDTFAKIYNFVNFMTSVISICEKREMWGSYIKARSCNSHL